MTAVISAYHHLLGIFEVFALSIVVTWYFRPKHCSLFDDFDYQLKRRLSRVFTNLDLDQLDKISIHSGTNHTDNFLSPDRAISFTVGSGNIA